DDGELCAAEPAGRVRRTKKRLEQTAHVLEDQVAKGMAVGVVRILEMVEIHQDERDRPAVALSREDLLGEALVEVRAVPDPGEPVHQRSMGRSTSSRMRRGAAAAPA